jgi:hypothetical protein
MRPNVVLAPLRHLTGVYVWQGNHMRGMIWFDKLGWRWTTRMPDFRFGVCNSFDEALDRLV